MGTMNKCNIGGYDFYYDRVQLGDNAGGAAVFAVKDEDTEAKKIDMYYWVVLPCPSKWMDGVASPDAGRVTCICQMENDAKMIAAAINIAHIVSMPTLDKIGDLIESKLEDNKKLGEKLGYDVDAINKEIERLIKEGKTPSEVFEILKSKRENFRKKPAAEVKKDGGEW